MQWYHIIRWFLTKKSQSNFIILNKSITTQFNQWFVSNDLVLTHDSYLANLMSNLIQLTELNQATTIWSIPFVQK